MVLYRCGVLAYSAGDVNPSDSTSPSGTRSVLSSLLMGIAWVFGGAAGLLFWVGGRAIHEMTHSDRILSEVATLTRLPGLPIGRETSLHTW